MRSWLRLSINSFIPSRLKAAQASFFSWAKRSSKKKGRKSRAVLGIRIMPRTLPTSSATKGFWRNSSINNPSFPWEPGSTIPRELKDADVSTPRSAWLRNLSKPAIACDLQSFSFCPIASIGMRKGQRPPLVELASRTLAFRGFRSSFMARTKR